MGQEISDSEFDAAAFDEFRHRVDEETRLLGEWLADGQLIPSQRRFGFEVEGWLIDADARPAALNQDFLAAVVDDPGQRAQQASGARQARPQRGEAQADREEDGDDAGPRAREREADGGAQEGRGAGRRPAPGGRPGRTARPPTARRAC